MRTVAIVFSLPSGRTEGTGREPSLASTALRDALIDAVAAAQPRATIVVLGRTGGAVFHALGVSCRCDRGGPGIRAQRGGRLDRTGGCSARGKTLRAGLPITFPRQPGPVAKPPRQPGLGSHPHFWMGRKRSALRRDPIRKEARHGLPFGTRNAGPDGRTVSVRATAMSLHAPSGTGGLKTQAGPEPDCELHRDQQPGRARVAEGSAGKCMPQPPGQRPIVRPGRFSPRWGVESRARTRAE